MAVDEARRPPRHDAARAADRRGHDHGRRPAHLMPMRFRSGHRNHDDEPTPEPASWFDPPTPAPAAYYEDGRLVLPARSRPARDVLVRAAEDARIFRQVMALCDFLGEGRALTDRGNLKLADAAALVARAGDGRRARAPTR